VVVVQMLVGQDLALVQPVPIKPLGHQIPMT
jgi:hypothetical protein